jgi:predicted porin
MRGDIVNITNKLSLAALVGLAPAAWAQSTVTLSGIVDAAVRNVTNEGVGSLTTVLSGSNSTSRLVFTAREDLGNGLAAGVHLEHGFLVDSGSPAASNKFFDRRSTVSLFSKNWGELRLGRDFVPSYTAWSRHDPFSYVGAARSANFVSSTPVGPIRSAFGTSANTTVRSDNGVQWVLPRMAGGFDATLMWAPREGGAATDGLAEVSGLRVGYTAKGWHVTAASTRSRNNLTIDGSFSDNVLGGGFTAAGTQFTAAWREFKYSQSSQTMMMVAAQRNFGLHEIKGSWIKADLKGRVGTTSVNGEGATQIGVGYAYNLSKRTALYGTAAQVSNDGQSRFSITDGRAGLVAGGNSRGYEVGVRHRF